MSGPDLHVRLRGPVGELVFDVALAAPAGAVTSLAGASGAGKTTLLRAVAGLQRLDGQVRLGDAVWQDSALFLPPHRRGVGMVFQHGALFPHLTVAQNLAYAADRAPGGHDVAKAAAELLDLGPLMQRRPARLSGGERRRVAIGRALASAPRLLLLDEPLSGLDPEAKAALTPALRRTFETLRAPVLLVTHDAAEVAGLASHRLRLANGRVVIENGVDRAGAAP